MTTVPAKTPRSICLEQTFAERVGKEAAVFVPSGTMGNQIALRLLGVPGTAVVAGRSQHVVAFENGAAAMNASVQWHTVDDSRGELGFSDVKLAVEPRRPPPGAGQRGVRGEHAHGELGSPWDVDALDAIAGLGRPVHLDGARLFNAEVATGVSAARVRQCGDDGDVLPLEGTRRSGRVAARRDPRTSCAVHAASESDWAARCGRRACWPRPGSSRFARTSTGSLRTTSAPVSSPRPSRTDGPIAIDPERVRTNLVVFRPPDADGLLAHLQANGVLGGTLAPGVVRLVTHLDLDDDGILIAQKAIASAP